MGSFVNWLKHVLFGPPKRDVSRLSSVSEADVDVVAEVVDTSGGPLKPGHRRRALRDPRLLPKVKTPLRFGQRRKRVMSAADAGRLFSTTFLTHNRQIRDLLPDEEQLQRYGLPVWRTEADLAAALGLTLGQLRFYSVHREKDRFWNYVAFAIPKRDGGKRVIMAPKRRLKALQRKLLQDLVGRLPVSEWAHGFRPRRSIRSGAEPHVGRRVVLHLDIKEFFPSLHLGRVRGLLIAYGYGYSVATALALLMTEAERQPVQTDEGIYHVPVSPRYCVQGAPTSPGLGNAILLRLDRRLAGLARKFGYTYTRYADDLTFSGDDEPAVHKLRKLVMRIVFAEGFTVRPEKTRVMRRSACQRVTGVVVNQVLGLPRRERRRLRAMCHRLGQAVAVGQADAGAVNQLRGRLAYLSMLNPAQAARLRPAFLASPPRTEP